jgi:hypothetical protein
MQTAELADLVRPGMTIALGDGFGAPVDIAGELSRAAAQCGDVRLILGWMPVADHGIDFAAFSDVRTFMPGWGLRAGSDAGLVSFAPVSLATMPALLHGPWRPDLLVAALTPVIDGGFRFGSEVSWQRAAIDAGAMIAAVASSGLPCADAGPTLPADQVVVVGRSDRPPATIRVTSPGPEHLSFCGDDRAAGQSDDSGADRHRHADRRGRRPGPARAAVGRADLYLPGRRPAPV